MTQSPLLKVRDLTTSFFTSRGEVQAVRGVDFDIHAGEVLGIVGESGSGKSITCMSVLRLLKNNGRTIKGTAHFEGRDLLELSELEMRRLRGNDVAMIFQDPMTSLNPTLTVGEQIIETIIAHKNISRSAARERVVELFELVKIPEAASRLGAYPHEFSGGMRQRVMIAMALSCDPKLLIADEPTTALDVTIQRQILLLLKEIQSRLGMAIILITHDLGVIAEVTDRILVMYGGTAMETANVHHLFDKPMHPYTQGLLASVPNVNNIDGEKLKPIPGSPPDMLRPPKGCPFMPRCDKAMEICVTTGAPEFEIDDAQSHKSRCWLHHPDAPQQKGDAA